MRPYSSPLLLALVGLLVTGAASYMLPGLIRLAPRLCPFEALAFFALHAGLIFGGLALIDRAARHADDIHRCSKQRSPRRCTR